MSKRDLTQEPKVTSYLDYREFLKDWIDFKKTNSQAYSHRAIAAKVGLKSGGHISQILSGRAKLSQGTLDQLTEWMKLTANESLYLKHLTQFNHAKTQEEQKKAYERLKKLKGASAVLLDKDQFEYYSHWSYSAIREALTIFNIQDEAADLSVLGRQLIPPLTQGEVARGVELLKRLGLIEPDAQGYLKSTSQILSTGKQVQGLYLNEYVQEVLKLAHGAVQRIPVGEKYNSWISMTLGKSSFPQVIEELRSSRERILKIVKEEKHPSRVYHLNLNLFPFTQVRKKVE